MTAPDEEIAAKNRAKLFSLQTQFRDQLTNSRVPTISPKKLRAEIDAIQDPDKKYICQFYYLTAARLSEATSKVYDTDFLTGATRPYGNFMKMEITNFETPEKEVVKTWLITLAVAKRGLKITAKKREKVAELTEPIVTEHDIEKALLAYNKLDLLKKHKQNEIKIDPLLIAVLLGRVKTKTIALPLHLDYEPWTYDMLKYLTKKYGGKLPESVPFTLSRQQLRFAIRDALKNIMPPASANNAKNLIRHWRITHLVDYYNFEPAEVTLYTGWTVNTAFAQQGAVGGSTNLDEYYHGQWRKYYPKLLKPITEIAN